MANTVIQLKHSTITGNVPSSLANGEISINNRDGKFFYSTPAGVVTTHYPYLGPAGLNKEVQFNDSGTLGSNSGLTFDKTTGVFNAPIVASSNNGNGTNFKVGDDAWIGDINNADTLRISGQQNSANAYIVFGNSNANTLGRAGSGPLTYTGAFTATGTLSGNELTSTMSSGSEGGQVNLAIPASGTSLVGSVTIDVYQNQLRFFQGDSAKGAYIDLTSASAGVGTNLLAPNSSTDGWARGQANASFEVANSAASYANSSFLKANTPSYIANSAASYANAAFTTANNAVTSTNGSIAWATANSAASYANASFITANNAFTSTNGSIAWATANSAGSYGNSGFAVANSASSYANAAFAVANTGSGSASAGSYANSGFAVANSAASYANAAFITANNSFTSTNGSIAWSTANSAGSYANSGFAVANNAFTSTNGSIAWATANSAGSYANSGFSVANSAASYANAAFAIANTGSGSSSAGAYANAAFAVANSAASTANASFSEDSFTGDGSTTAFTLSTSANQYTVLVAVNGVLQPNNAYSIIGTNTTITLSEAPALSDTLTVKKVSGGGGGGGTTTTTVSLSPFLLMGA